MELQWYQIVLAWCKGRQSGVSESLGPETIEVPEKQLLTYIETHYDMKD
jgi:hypothetical protein